MRQSLGPEIEVELIGGSNGVFEIMADGRLAFSKKQSGRFPDDGEIVRLIKEQ